MDRCHHCGAVRNGSVAHPPATNEPPQPPPEPSPDELLVQAMRLGEEGIYDDAILLTRRAIKIKPDFAAAYAFLGEMYERVGEWEKALAAYDQALALDKDYEPARLGRERLQQRVQSPIPSPEPPKPAPRWVWGGHPIPLLAAVAFVVGMLFAVRVVVPPVPKTEPVINPPITIAPSRPQPFSAPATAPPMPAALEAAVKRGIDALNANKYDDAIRWFERALQIAPNSNEARSWLLIARAMKEEAQSRALPPVIAARPQVSPPPPLPQPNPAPSSSSSRQTLPAERPSRTTQTSPAASASSSPSAGTSWGWQPPNQPLYQPPVAPQGVPYAAPYSPHSGMMSPAGPSSPALPSPQEPPPVLTPSPAPPSSIPLPPPSIEDLERQAAQKVYEGDLAGAVTLYRAILERGVGVEREGPIRQQLALALQQLRRYEEAAEEYARAIAAYQRQIERGIQVQAAQRGIEACQRGLEICQRAR